MKALVKTILSAILILAWGLPHARGDAFDCREPSSPLGKLICSDALLRTADHEENAVYDAALLASLDRSLLLEEERVWFEHEILPYNWFAQHHMPVDNAKIVAAYRSRADALRQETQSWRKFRRSVPSATLATTCLAPPINQPTNGCTVAAFASINGAPSLRYQLQTYPKPAARSALIIFAAVPERPDEWLPLAVTSSQHGALTSPQAAASPVGTLLLVAVAGTGDGDESALYRLGKDALEDIDDRSWLETLRTHLPDGLELSPEIVADYGKMQAVSKVTRSQSTCCAVGSTATIDLTIEDDRIAVKGVSFDGPPGPSSNSAN